MDKPTLWRMPTFTTHPFPRPHTVRRGWCMNVVDGDTVDCLVEMGLDVYQYVRVRLNKVDCPEIFHPKTENERLLGLRAKLAAQTLLLNKPVLLDFGAEAQIEGRYIADITYYVNAAPSDYGKYLINARLTKQDVSV